ncbi:OmpA family protein [Haliangium ochraceum]|uniref:Peptidoglycan-associated lipoprotein n=1 Tax=Haliangium ochraceum (strain DSM 14365 / JCM 11303 / SMP-2) TaxID=502025 RepID=D0LXZ6_HALO1|nr:OmpA family protein [Haliangium ochraceum]ACY14351.1 OmpA/MotB domain protein [Haliangium ochraceum DSM 14365]
MIRFVYALMSTALVLSLAACGSKPKAEATEPTSENMEVPETDDEPMEERTEAATGELRDVLIILERVHFPLDSTDLPEDAREALAEAAPKLANNPDVHLYVDGHADQRGTEEYNVALGERRARAVSDYLTRMGVSADNLHLVSFGESRPVSEQGTNVAMAKNRRVDFRLMRGDVRLIVEEGTLVDDEGDPMNESE